MAYSYKIKPNAEDMHFSVSPYWMALFIPFDIRDSFNRLFDAPGSKREALANPTKETETLLLVGDDLLAWSTTSSKSSHVSNAQFTLFHTNKDYTQELAPDDWVMFWVFDNQKDFIRVAKQVKRLEPANGMNDGLKFIGRIDGVRKIKSRDPNGGLTVQYSITANGFSEFDSTIYYNEAVRKTYANQFQFMPDFGVALNDFVLSGSVHPQTAIPKLLSICLGKGPGELSRGVLNADNAAIIAGNDEQMASDIKTLAKSKGLIASPNQMYRIPASVASLLGVTVPEGQVFTYSDILRQVIGVQQYDGSGWMPERNTIKGNTYYCWPELDGDSKPYAADFNNRSIWAILETYLNKPINEIYTCLRVDDSNPENPVIMPTFVCRQLPLNSDEYAATGLPCTRFLSLPRWDIDDSMVLSIDTGRSNSTRFNYVFINGQDQIGNSTLTNLELQHGRNPPITDDADIMRSGLRMFVGTVSGNITEVQNSANNSPGGRWSKMMADILMGGHLKFTGTITLQGVQQPICHGDNVLVDGVLYHIERIQHSGSINNMGLKSFVTALAVTNGISIETETNGRLTYPDMKRTVSISIKEDSDEEASIYQNEVQNKTKDRHVSASKDS